MCCQNPMPVPVVIEPDRVEIAVTAFLLGVAQRDWFRADEAFAAVCALLASPVDNKSKRLIARCLRRLGWEKYRESVKEAGGLGLLRKERYRRAT